MLIYPAIDLQGGKVVRLRQGFADQATIYGDDPAAVACQWERAGARWLHVVDLDGAFAGAPQNTEAIQTILEAVRIPVQLGGGLRSRQQVASALEMGVSRCVVGTKACESPDVLRDWVREFGLRLAVGIDARDGFVAVRGWVERTQLPAVEFARQVDALGVQTIIFTDVATDGMLTGPNVEAIAKICAAVNCHVIASGGVRSAADVRRLRGLALPNLTGVIIGRALYDGRVDLAQLH